MPIGELMLRQRVFFESGQTYDLRFRIEQLKKLKRLLRSKEKDLSEAIYADFGKSEYMTYFTELAFVHNEINLAIAKLPCWAKTQKARTNLPNLPGRSYIVPEPYGNALVIGAWNYPYQLSLIPLVSALAAGNTVILKPGELAPHAAAALAELINDNFESGYLRVVTGGAETAAALLGQRFNKIFFTGGAATGKLVMRAAAEHLTPVTLELGGKSPVIVWRDAPLELTAKRIVWGKFLNAGQTCVAPDFVLARREIYPKLLEQLREQIKAVVGDERINREFYPQIINQRHLERLRKLLGQGTIYYGGEVIETDRYLRPTILTDVKPDDPVMREEIFGPILPVLPVQDETEIFAWLNRNPQPLALYVFSKDKKLIEKLISRASFGGATVNDTVMHICNPNLPFGGVQNSGLGSYHGKFGFDAFTHYKSVLKRNFRMEPPLKYPPFSRWKKKLIRLLIG